MKEHNLSWLLDTDKENKENFDYLIRLVKRNVVVPFLGAGFSANFNYPGWESFLEEQGEKYNLPEIKENLLKRKEYEKAASLLKEKLQDGLEYVLIKNFGDHIYKSASGIHELELLPQIFRSLILTTNFDEVIEMLYAKKMVNILPN